MYSHSFPLGVRQIQLCMHAMTYFLLGELETGPQAFRREPGETATWNKQDVMGALERGPLTRPGARVGAEA